MIFKLPLKYNSKLQFEIISERNPCSDNCLYNKLHFIAFHVPGLGGEDISHLSFPILTDSNTIVKKKKKHLEGWNKLGYEVLINDDDQFNIYSELIERPIFGLVPIKRQCKCSIEMEFLEGDLSYKYSLPNSNYYETNFDTKGSWSWDQFETFTKSTLLILKDIHTRGYIHGDAAAQNFIVNKNGVQLIDLDNLTKGNSNLFIQELISYTLYTIIPILMSFETENTVRSLLTNIINLVSHASYDETIYSKIESVILEHLRVENNNPLVNAYFYNLSQLRELYNDNSSLANDVQQLQIQLLEQGRVIQNAEMERQKQYDEEMKKASDYSISLENKFSEVEKYAKSLEIVLQQRENEITNLNNELKRSNEQNAILNESINDLELKNDEFKKKIIKLEEQVITLEDEKASLNERINTLVDDIEKEKNNTIINKISKNIFKNK